MEEEGGVWLTPKQKRIAVQRVIGRTPNVGEPLFPFGRNPGGSPRGALAIQRGEATAHFH